jgi:cation diffusion facilitator CzcD-associated flavoprotein CzcO
VWVGGAHYELDCLIFASGFEVGTDAARRSGFETTGRSGVTLTERWADGMRTLHGIHARDFPNLFIVGHSQGSNLISNITQNLTEAAATIATVVAHARAIDASLVETTADAEQAWITLLEGSTRSTLANPDCTPGYYNNEGRPMGRRERLNGSGYPDGPIAFWNYMDTWRNSGEFVGLEFR